MTPLSQMILDNYQVRKTKKQKQAFIALMQEHFPQLQIQQGGLPKSRNLIFGDVENAKVIATAHYDTCARLPFPNFITPRSRLVSFLYGFALFFPVFVFVILLNILLNFITDNSWVLFGVSLITTFTLLSMMYFGPANKHNANDNTSGVIVLTELMGTLNQTELDKIAFVFFDNEEIGMLGSSYFRKKHKKLMEDKLLINFDCVADGDHIMIAASKAARGQLGQQIDDCFRPKDGKSIVICNSEKVHYPSDQVGFKNSLVIAAFHHKKGLGYYLGRIHTSRDTVFDKANIALVCGSILKVLKKL